MSRAEEACMHLPANFKQKMKSGLRFLDQLILECDGRIQMKSALTNYANRGRVPSALGWFVTRGQSPFSSGKASKNQARCDGKAISALMKEQKRRSHTP